MTYMILMNHNLQLHTVIISRHYVTDYIDYTNSLITTTRPSSIYIAHIPTLCTLTVARSHTWSTACTTPWTFSPSFRHTCTREAPATTWALVRIKPSERTINPDPLALCLSLQSHSSQDKILVVFLFFKSNNLTF